MWRGSWLEPPAGQRAVGLQDRDLLVQQVALNQRRPKPGFQPVTFQFFARREFCRQCRLTGGEKGVTPTRQCRRCHTE